METVLLGSLPAVTANTTQQIALAGKLPDGYELLGLVLQFNGTMISGAGAGAVVAANHRTIMEAIYTRVRMDAWGITDVYNCRPAAARTLALVQNGDDPWVTDPKIAVGATVPASGGSAQAFGIAWPIYFFNRGLETPEQFTPSTNQFNVDGHVLNVELGAGGSGGISVGGVTATVTSTSIQVYALIQPTDTAHFGPPHRVREFTITNDRHSEAGKFIDMLLADERDSYTVAAQVSQITVTRDDRSSPANIPPTVLAQMFLRSLPPAPAGSTSYNPISNSVGGTGSQITPVAWPNAAIKPTEWQYPLVKRERVIYQNLAASGSAAATYLSHQILPMERAQGEVSKVAARHRLNVSRLDDLEVRGGGGRDNDVLSEFKGRYLALKGARKIQKGA